MESIQGHSPSATGPTTGNGSHSGQRSETGGGGLLAVARELYARLSAGDDRLGYSVGPGCVWTWRRACVESCGAANCAHDRPRRPVEGAIVPPREWRPAVEVVRGLEEAPRVLTPWTIAHHLTGQTTIAPASSSWTSWVALDIDAHAPAGDEAAKRAAIARRDRMLAAVWRACGWSSTVQPIVLLSPGQGFHVWIPITRDCGPDGRAVVEDHRWPSGWARSWMVHHLADAGIDVRGGAVEVFPSGNRLRAPCGRGSLLLQATNPDDPDALELAPVAGTFIERRDGSRVRQVAAMAAAFCARWDAQRRPLAAWLGDRPGAQWDPRWGFLAHRVATPTAPPDSKNSGELAGRTHGHSHERDAVLGPPSGAASGSGSEVGRVAGAGAVGPVRGGGGKRRARGRVSETDPVKLPQSPVGADTSTREAGGPLVRGAEYHAKVARLLAEGITTPGTRHDAVLILTFHFACSGLSDPEVLDEIRTWCRAHAHAGSEATARGAFERECVGCAARYLRSHGHGWRRGGASGRRRVVPRPLAVADAAVIGAVDPAVVDEVRALLGFLAGLARTPSGRPGEAVELAGGLLYALAPERRVVVEGKRRRAWSVAVEELVRIGVLSLHTGAAPGAHGRVFCCWYRFGSGELPAAATVPAPAWAEAAPPAAPVPTLAAPASPPRAVGEVVVVRELAAREVPEGRVRVLAAVGERFPRVLLEPAAAAPEVYTPARGAWWVRMYRARRFTPAELESATPGRVVPFPGVRPPWARAPGAPLVGPPVGGGAVVSLRAAPGVVSAGAVDPRAALGARLGAPMDGIDRDLAAVALRALARWRPV